jgi:hypothetical protein
MSGQQYRYYWKSASWMSWPDASKECQRVGMRLVRLHSALHATWLDDALNLRSNFPSTFWIGLNDRASEGVYVWDSGRSGAADVATDFYHWTEFLEPDISEGPKRCVMAISFKYTQYEYWPFVGGTWQRYDCSTTLPFVCGSVEDSSDPCVTHPCATYGGRRNSSCSPSPPSAAAPLAITYNRTCTCNQPDLQYTEEYGCVPPYDLSSAEVTVIGVLHRIYFAASFSWTEANRLCCEAGMKLVEVQDEDHATQLHTAYKEAGGSSTYWLGLNDRKEEGTWTWTSGAGACLESAASPRGPAAAASYTRWAAAEPGNTCKLSLIEAGLCIDQGEDCVEASMADEGRWHDQHCSVARSFICMAR